MKKTIKKITIKSLCSVAGAAVLTASAWAQSGTIEDICNQADIECSFEAAGVIVGKPGSTHLYAGGVQQAADKFEHYFGQEAPKAAVVLGEILDPSIRQNLQTLYPVVLPWLTLQDREDMIARAVRAQVSAQRPDLEGEALEAVVKRSVEASLSAGNSNRDEGIHEGVFAHELGHLFFIETYWPEDNLDVVNTNPGEVARYGGPAPDWLDEMAAVLLENEALTAGRSTMLATADEAEDNFAAFWSLDEYFTMTHPVFEQARRVIAARQNTEEGRGRGGVVMLTRDQLDNRNDGRDPAMFYAQSRGFADYLIEKTADTRIFASVAKHVADGGDMESWLRTRPKNELPTTLTALEADFKSWVKGKYDGPEALQAGHGHGH